MLEVDRIVETNTEQGITAAIDYQKAQRLLDRLTKITDETAEMVIKENQNLSAANNAIDKAFAEIEDNLKGGMRGGPKGIHGFISEAAQKGVANARNLVVGGDEIYKWPRVQNEYDDLRIIEGDIPVQLKFQIKDLSLEGVEKHITKYPGFLENDHGKYMIPSDFYEDVKKYLEMPAEEAGLLRNADYSKWKKVHEVFNKYNLTLNDFEKSDLTYDSVQLGRYESTLERERDNLAEINEIRKDEQAKEIENRVTQETQPTLEIGIKTAVTSAVIEGGMTFCLGIIQKRKSGLAIRDFSDDDWKDVLTQAGIGTIKGCVRGGSIYYATNFTNVHAFTASAIVTASFGMAEQIYRFRQGKISKGELVLNSETVCLEAAVSGLSSFLGQTFIPIPVLGAVIGNSLGTMMYQIAKSNFTESEQALMKQFLEEQAAFDEVLAEEYRLKVDQLNRNFAIYINLLNEAFEPDIQRAFQGSVVLAKSLGLTDQQILDSPEDVWDFFME